MTAQIFAFDEPGGGAVWLAASVPRHWLHDGHRVTARRVPTRYGRVDLVMQYEADTRTLHAEITPQPSRAIPEIHFRARDPEGGRTTSAECTRAGGTPTIVKPDGDLFLIDDVRTPLRLEVLFE